MTPAASIEPRIEHVVVLMLENRSFDHMLGFLPHPDPTFIGLQAGGYHNVAADGSIFPATNDGEPGDAAPDHSHAGVLEQVSGYGDVTTNGGFIRSYASTPGNAAAGPRVMRCLDSITRLPVLARLATEFAVCDSWFSSVPGERGAFGTCGGSAPPGWTDYSGANARSRTGSSCRRSKRMYVPTTCPRTRSSSRPICACRARPEKPTASILITTAPTPPTSTPGSG